MTQESFKRKLTAILSADVEGYSRLMGEDEDATIRTLTAYRELMSTLIRKHRGRVIDSPGDNLLAEFLSVVDAVRCAVEIQEELRVRNAELSENRQMKFRIGINLGDVVEEGERIYGDGVNITARVEGLAEAGGICISGTVYDSIKNKLSLSYEPLGEHTVKNIKEPVRVYRMRIGPEAAAPVVREKRAGPRRWQKAALTAVAVLVVVAGAWAIWNFYFRPPPIEPASIEKMNYPLPDKPSIAVLPFDNLSGDPGQDYIADGITDNIITALSYIPQMFVIARNSSFTYKGKAVKVQQVSEELGVRYILEGSVLKSGDKVRITAQLIDALTGGHLWSERYDRDLKDLFGLLDEITQAITVALQVKLTHGEQAHMWHGSTRNLEAWGYAVKGLGIFYHYTQEAMVKSRKFFEQALTNDPEYAHAATMLAATHIIDFRFRYTDSRDKSLNSAIEMAKKAVALDDNYPLAHSMWQHIHMIQKQYDEAVKEGRKAIALGPNNAEVHILLGEALLNSGKYEESVKMCEKAIRLHPHTPRYYLAHMANAYYGARRYEKSLAAAGQFLNMARKIGHKRPQAGAHLMSALALMELDREKDAREHVSQALKLRPETSNLDFLRKYSIWSSYKDQILLQRILDSLSKAGVPEHAPIPLPDKPSIAVLAFDNMSGDSKQEYIADGISENIITTLSKVRNLFVISRKSSFSYKGKPVKAQRVGKELGVRYVLEGSVQRSGDRIRVIAQLIDAINGKHLWSERYDRDFKDIFQLQDELTSKIVTSLQIKLTAGEGAKIWLKNRPSNLQYVEKSFEAWFYLFQFNKEANIKAKGLLKELITLEPEYYAGYTGLAFAHLMDVHHGSSSSPRESLSESVKLCKKAITLDESQDMPHSILGHIYALAGKFDKAIEESELAIALNPNSDAAYGFLGRTLTYAGRIEEAINHYKKAARLNPLNLCSLGLGNAYREAGQYEGAITEYKKCIIENPENRQIYDGLAMTFALAGRYEEARKAWSELLKLDPKISVEKVFKVWPYGPANRERKIAALNKAGIK